jgi:hypothetical protein
MRKLMLALTVAGLVVWPACSDDDNGTKDSGPNGDTIVVQDKGVINDTGPAGEASTEDQGPGADSTPTKELKDYVPGDNDVQGWTEDQSVGAAGVETANTDAEIEALINGHQAPFAVEKCSKFAMQQYQKDFGGGCSGTLELMLWQCPAKSNAQKLFDDFKQKGETEAGLTFTDIPNVTDKGIWAFDANFISYSYKNVYFMEITADNSAGACKTGVNDDVVKFVQLVTGNLP